MRVLAVVVVVGKVHDRQQDVLSAIAKLPGQQLKRQRTRHQSGREPTQQHVQQAGCEYSTFSSCTRYYEHSWLNHQACKIHMCLRAYKQSANVSSIKAMVATHAAPDSLLTSAAPYRQSSRVTFKPSWR